MILTLKEIIGAVNGKTTNSTKTESIVKGLFTDSREAYRTKNGLFVAIKGENSDGHSFVREVLSTECYALVDNPAFFTTNTILVDNTRIALQQLAEWYRKSRLSSTKIIGVTGSVGKTSTKDMVALAVGAGMVTSKTQGNKNSQSGLPITVLETEPFIEAAVMEMGMSEPGEITRLSRISRPEIAVITNIGYSHIQSLGSRENICAEKLSITDYMPEDGIVILNGDEPLLKQSSGKHRRVFCSVSDKNCDCYATDIKSDTYGKASYTAHIFGTEVEVSLSVAGLHNVVNSLLSIATAAVLGVDLKKAAEALKFFTASGLRQKIYTKNGYTVIADCYNASPESMAAALNVLKGYKGRRIAVLGDMLELGGLSEMLHEEVGKRVLESNVDILITFGSMAKHIAKLVDDSVEVYFFEGSEYDKAADFMKSVLMPGDTVLFKASNRMKLQYIIDRL